jgi:hypothetical protein
MSRKKRTTDEVVIDKEFLAELDKLEARPASAPRSDPDDAVDEILPSATVTVRRQWNGHDTLVVPVSQLRDFHWRDLGGGCGQRAPRQFLHARMLCTSIPDGSYFPHSCRHGPPPHEILVCIVKKDNTKPLYDALTDLVGRRPLR